MSGQRSRQIEMMGPSDFGLEAENPFHEISPRQAAICRRLVGAGWLSSAAIHAGDGVEMHISTVREVLRDQLHDREPPLVLRRQGEGRNPDGWRLNDETELGRQMVEWEGDDV